MTTAQPLVENLKQSKSKIKEPKIPGYDVITTTDKAKRDDIFRQMRASTDPLERASVKFSGNEPLLDDEGKQVIRQVAYLLRGKGGELSVGRVQFRPQFVSTWSVAIPRT